MRRIHESTVHEDMRSLWHRKPTGETITLLSSLGGAGSTTLAYAIAGNMSRYKSTCLLDMEGDTCLYWPEVSNVMNDDNTIASLLGLHHSNDMSFRDVDTAASALSSWNNMRFIIQPDNTNDYLARDYEGMTAVLDTLRMMFDVVIITMQTGVSIAALKNIANLRNNTNIIVSTFSKRDMDVSHRLHRRMLSLKNTDDVYRLKAGVLFNKVDSGDKEWGIDTWYASSPDVPIIGMIPMIQRPTVENIMTQRHITDITNMIRFRRFMTISDIMNTREDAIRR